MSSERPASRARRMADAVLSVDETLEALNATVDHMHATLSSLDGTIAKLDAAIDRFSQVVVGVDDLRSGMADTIGDVGELTHQVGRLVDALEVTAGPALWANDALRRIGLRGGRDPEHEFASEDLVDAADESGTDGGSVDGDR